MNNPSTREDIEAEIRETPLSKCHNAPTVLIEGNAWDVKTIRVGATYSYGCTECKQACDLAKPLDPKTNDELRDFLSDPKNIAKAVEGSMDKRNAVLDHRTPADSVDKQIENSLRVQLSPLCDRECHTTHFDEDVSRTIDQIRQIIEQETLKARIKELETIDWNNGDGGYYFVKDRLAQLEKGTE